MIVEAPNMAYLRSIRRLTNTLPKPLPKGLKSILNEMDISTAKRLSVLNNVKFEMNDKQFFEEDNTNNKANMEEMNVICSSVELFGDIDERDLMDFMNHLATKIEFASEHKIGRIINEIISGWRDKVDFDNEVYYHARARKPDLCPYTEQEMRKAPYGITCAGRYSHAGDSHYYFSDKKEGAYNEIAKHGIVGKIVQIATIKPIKRIAMIDLSMDVDKPNKFLRYIRFAPQDFAMNIIREYLIPCFVVTCCKRNGIEGIKYYGSKEYNNYVSWEDGYFVCTAIEDR
jgi:hypothetical protein